MSSASQTTQNRRLNERHPHRAYATLSYGERSLDAHILNLSKRGALIAVLGEHDLACRAPIDLTIETHKGKVALRGTVAHLKAHYLGLNCTPTTDADQALLDATIAHINSSVLSS